MLELTSEKALNDDDAFTGKVLCNKFIFEKFVKIVKKSP